MSIRTVILSLVVALALGGASWYLLSRSEAPQSRGPVQPGSLLMDVDPAAVLSLTISSPDGSTETIQRDRATGAWTVVVNVGKPNERPWALQPSAVQALVRRLTETRVIAVPEKADSDAGVGSDPTVVDIALDNGGRRTLRLSSRNLGGRCLVELDAAAKPASGPGSASTPPARGDKTPAAGPTLAVIDDTLLKAFRNPGPRAWRETAAIPGIGGDITRIRLENRQRTLVLGRVAGKWALIEPVAAPVDQELVRKLIAGFSELSIVDFLDDAFPADDTSGVSSPVARIVIETDRTFIDEKLGSNAGINQISTSSSELLIGKPSDGTLQRRYAMLPGNRSAVVTITATGLTQELFNAARFISPRAIDTPVGDIGGVVMTPADLQPSPGAPATPPTPGTAESPASPTSFPAHVYRRALDKWVELAGGKETPLDDDAAKRVNELLGFFSGDTARGAELELPAGWNELGKLELLSLDGRPIGTLTIGSAAEGGLVARTIDAAGRPFYRMYAHGRSPLLLLSLAESLKATTPAAPAAGGASGPIKDDVMK